MDKIFQNLYEMTAFSNIIAEPQFLIMYAIAFVLLYLGIKKQYEPLLLIPIAFGVLLANFPGGDMGVIQADENGMVMVNGVLKNIWEMPLHDIAHELGLMNFIYYMVIFYSIINPAKDLSKAMYSIQKGLASMQRIDKILNADNPIADPADPRPLPARALDIRYRDVDFAYGEHPVLSDINLDIPAGATVAIVGQSGSGKSTLADLLPRFYDVARGSITIGGTDIRDMRVHDLRSLMGNVNQEAILFNDTFYNNITFGVSDATMDQVIDAARIANAHEFIAASPQGYDTPIGDRGCRLSGGQRQRLSIARAILKNPPILILDEATSALDSESEHLVQQALDRLMANRTTLVIAHRLSTIRNADLICVLHEGRIVESGTHDSLLALGGYYKHLVDMQSF